MACVVLSVVCDKISVYPTVRIHILLDIYSDIFIVTNIPSLLAKVPSRI
jgi:hypothetical protein